MSGLTRDIIVVRVIRKNKPNNKITSWMNHGAIPKYKYHRNRVRGSSLARKVSPLP
ncbi:hypothetical protein D3C73_1637870 [compost metagenome]